MSAQIRERIRETPAPGLLAENHHPGGNWPPEPGERYVVDNPVCAQDWLRTMQLMKLPPAVEDWHSLCIYQIGVLSFSRNAWHWTRI
jgi:hypothetical protein